MLPTWRRLVVARYRLLVIEDSAVSAMAIKLVLHQNRQWSSVVYVPDLATALVACQLQRPDLVTMDLDLGDGNGLDALKLLRSACNAPIVVVSASIYPGSPTTALALAFGANACFEKANLLSDPDRFLALLMTTIEAAAPGAEARQRRARDGR
jgi:chemotaxis response regulator CheB